MALFLVVLFFSNSLSHSLLLSFLHVTHSRRNSDSEDEDSGSARSATVFSRAQKAERRLDGSCQRPSLLLELATKRAVKSPDSHAARRSSSASDEPRCPCLHEPACWGSGLRHPSARFCCSINLGPDCIESGNLTHLVDLVQKHNV